MKQFFTGIKNLIAWLPVIWNDRDWDYNFLLLILRFKLKRMYKGLNACNNWKHCPKSNHENRNILVAINLLDRAIDEAWYRDNAFKEHERKYGEHRMTVLPGGRVVFYDENVHTAYEQAQADKDASMCLNDQVEHENQDWEYLFDLLKKRLRYWWD